MLWKKKITEYKRYYYCSKAGNEKNGSSKLFEQSLDVYKPIGYSSKDLPTVILVVGSGWVGHRAFIYAQTSWWNSSGPQTIASLGCTCVCIRHRGAFCRIPSAPVVGQYLAGVLALLSAVLGIQKALWVTAMLALLMILLAIGGRGSADFEDMVEDVAKALQWLQNNKEVLLLEENSILKPLKSTVSVSNMTRATSESSAISTSSGDEFDSDMKVNGATGIENENESDPPFVFGGYSSGGHVAATLLQQSDEYFSRYGLPPPQSLFRGVLMISGVLAVRPESITLENHVDKSSRQETKCPITTAPGPSWFTSLILKTVWGEDAPKLPSPLAQLNDPALPHLLVGCNNEVFGLKILDMFFCSRQYKEKVQHVTGKPAKYVEVESDHWNILNSTALREILHDELPKLIAFK